MIDETGTIAYISNVELTDFQHEIPSTVRHVVFGEGVTLSSEVGRGPVLQYIFNSNRILTMKGTEKIDVSQAKSLDRLFYEYVNLEDLDLSNWDIRNVTGEGRTFSNVLTIVHSLKTLNLSGWDTTHMAKAIQTSEPLIAQFDVLNTITLGPKTHLYGRVQFNNPKNEIGQNKYTGKWKLIKDLNGNMPLTPVALTSNEFSNYDGTHPGTYVWETYAEPITVNYLDTKGKVLVPTETLEGAVADTFKIEAKKIPGYTLQEVQGEEQGWFLDKAQMVTYVYTKNPVKAADVTVTYVDESGKAIPNVSSQTISGNVGDSYDATTDIYKLAIDGYTLNENKLPTNGKGTLSDKAQTVTYVYTKYKNDIVNPESKQENKPSSNDKDNNQGTYSKQHSLPAAGEKERMTMISTVLGLILLGLTAVVSIFRFKKVNK